MTLRFGTDGVRGVANVELTPELRRRPRPGRGPGARAPGRVPRRPRHRACRGRCSRPRWPPGSPPRASTSIARRAAHAGVSPACRRRDGLPAAMISAWHNPFADNGIKFFAAGGRKLTDEVEAALEAELDRLLDDGRRRAPDGRRRRRRSRPGSATRRATRRPSSPALEGRRLDGLRVVLDCANGAAVAVAPRGASARSAPRSTVLNAAPDGTQHQRRAAARRTPRRSRPRCVAGGADVGLAFDGDADRVLAVDHDGAAGRRRPDHRDLRRSTCRDRGRLARRHGRRHRHDQPRVPAGDGRARHRGASRPPVGDRYVLEALERGRLVARRRAVGPRHLPRPRHHRRRPAHRAAGARRRRPRRAARWPSWPAVDDPPAPGARATCAVADRDGLDGAEALWPRGRAPSRPSWATAGRVLVRPCGTEPLVRVMVEAPTTARRPSAAADAPGRGRRARAAGAAGAPAPVAWSPCAGSSPSSGAAGSRAVPDVAALDAAARRAAVALLGRAGRPTDRPTSSRAVHRRRRSRSSDVDRLLRGAPGVRAPARAEPGLVDGRRSATPSAQLDARHRPRSSATSTPSGVRRRAPTSRRSTPRSSG